MTNFCQGNAQPLAVRHKLKVRKMSANLIKTTANTVTTDLAYILKFVEIVAKNLRVELRKEL